MKRKRYVTHRLIIRPYQLSDFAKWKQWSKKILPRKSKFDWQAASGRVWNLKEFRRIISKHSKMSSTDTTYAWIAFEKNSGDIVGFADVSVISRGPLQFANLGYRIDNRYWKRGYGGEILKKLIPAALKDLSLQRLEAVIDLDNKPSIRLARSAGLVKEGIRRNYYYQQTVWDDQVIYVATRDTFGLPTLNPKRS